MHELRTSRRATYHMLIAIARGKCYVDYVEAYFRLVLMMYLLHRVSRLRRQVVYHVPKPMCRHIT